MALELRDLDPYAICGALIDGRYRVERVVGQGGFGVVYRAHHTGFDSPVALKVLRMPRRAGGEAEDFAARFMLEGKLLFNLASLHPSIVRVFEMGMLNRRDQLPAPYLALEWLEGESLDGVIEARKTAGAAPFTLHEALDLLGGPVEALALAHGKRIVHRDVKPANLFLASQNGLVVTKLLDFGLAKAMGASSTTSELYDDSAFEQRALTPSYAAPEQWLQRLGATGAWTDVYSLALLFVELLSLQRPLRGEDGAQLMAACVDPAFRPTPRALGVEISDEVEAVFRRSLAVEPRARYRDAGEFWAALCAAAERPGSALASGTRDMPRRRVTMPVTSLELAATSDVTRPEAPMAAVQTRPRVRPRRTWKIAALVGCAGLASISIALLREPPAASAVHPVSAKAAGSAAVVARPTLSPGLDTPKPARVSSPPPLPLQAPDSPGVAPEAAPTHVEPRRRTVHKLRARPAANVPGPVTPAATPGEVVSAAAPTEAAPELPAPASPQGDPALPAPSLEELLDDAQLTHRR